MLLYTSICHCCQAETLYLHISMYFFFGINQCNWFLELLHDEEDEATLSPDSESEIYDDDDLDQWLATGCPRPKTGLPAIISVPRP